MANSPSAKKRDRQNARKMASRVARMSEIRGYVRKVEEAITEGDKASAATAFKMMQPKLMSGINKRVVHRNTAARKLSRLTKRIKVMVE